jgi:large repetitive protein
VETATRQLELSITENANLQIVPMELPTGTYGQPYAAMITATGGVPPISFIVELGELPEGLELMPDGTLSGTPMQVGRFRLVIQARDSGPGGVSALDVNTFELEIVDAPGFQIETTELPEAIVNRGYSATVKATGGIPPYDWSSGRLPSGMIARVDENGDFLIVGTAEQPGVTNILIEVADAQGRMAQRAFALVVADLPQDLAPKEDDGCGCAATAPKAGGTLLWLALFGLALLLRRR